MVQTHQVESSPIAVRVGGMAGAVGAVGAVDAVGVGASSSAAKRKESTSAADRVPAAKCV